MLLPDNRNQQCNIGEQKLRYSCFYSILSVEFKQGGESTREEMCLSFLLYYPASDLGICTSKTTNTALRNFSQQYIE